MRHDQIYFDESQYITDEMMEQIDMALHPDCACKVVRRSWFKRHEGAILLFILVLTLLGLYLILPYIPSIMWDLSTPITHLLGGR